MRGIFGPRAVAPLVAFTLSVTATGSGVANPADARPETAQAKGNAPASPVQPAPATPKPAATADASAGSELDAILAAEPQTCAKGPRFEGAKRLFIGCGAAGFIVLERVTNGWVVSERRATSGNVVGFFEHAGKVWVRLQQERAEVIAEFDAGGQKLPPLAPAPLPDEAEAASEPPRPQPPAPVATEPAAAPSGEVVKVDGLDVIVNLGEADGLSVRSRVVIQSIEPESQAKTSVIGRVVEAEPGRAKVRLGVNEVVSIGDAVAMTDDPVTASRVAPERATEQWELRGVFRPLLNLGNFGGGAIAELDAGYRTRYFHYGINLWPLAIASASEEPTLTTWSAFAYAGFDSWVFAAGLGLGAQAVNDTDFLTDEGSGLAMVQFLRLGAVDGLHLTARTRAVVFHSVTEFSGFEMQGQISVATDAWLIFRGGGGTMGFGYGEVAVRNLLQGNGKKGSVFLEVSVGGAGLFQRSCPQGPIISVNEDCSEHAVGGPLVGVGTEWRL